MDFTEQASFSSLLYQLISSFLGDSLGIGFNEMFR